MDIFAPRDAAAAARWLALSLATGALMLLVALPTARPAILSAPVSSGGAASVITVVALVVVLLTVTTVVVAVLRGWHPGGRAWGVTLLAVVAATVAGPLLWHDATALGQLFFLVPALLAASQLRAVAAWAVAALSAAGHLLIVLVLLPPGTAVVAWLNVTTVLVLLTHLLVRAGRRCERLVDELRGQAAVDPLTGLVTRRVLDDAARAALAGASHGHGTALLLVDLDHFKAINDTHGHPCGDAALVHLGNLLTCGAGPGAVVSRLGGDELAALLPACSFVEARSRAEATAELVRSTPVELPDGSAVAMTVSVGVAHSLLRDGGLEELYRAADAALYVAKRAGRDQVAAASVPVSPSRPAVDA